MEVREKSRTILAAPVASALGREGRVLVHRAKGLYTAIGGRGFARRISTYASGSRRKPQHKDLGIRHSGDSTNMATVDEKVKSIIVEQLQVDEAEVTPGASFQEDLGADSLDVVELVMQFEEAFDIQIPDEDAEKIKTVKDATDYIESHTKAK